MIINFFDYVPDPRYDGLPWTILKVDEGATKVGPWTEIFTKNLIDADIGGIDTDPKHPKGRSFTVTTATVVDGWYRIRFVDAVGNSINVQPIQNLPPDPVAYMPSLAEVGEIALGRTRDNLGNALGTFNANTQPTDTQVLRLIKSAADDVRKHIGTMIPDDLIDDARRVVAVRTAMLIELTSYGSEVATDRSPYSELRTLYKELLPDLIESVEVEEAGGKATDQVVGNFPSFGFPQVEGLLDKRM